MGRLEYSAAAPIFSIISLGAMVPPTNIGFYIFIFGGLIFYY